MYPVTRYRFLLRNDYPRYAARLAGGSEFRPWPMPYVVAAQSTCYLCSWAYNPILGGTDTPMVIKFVNNMCRHHGGYRGQNASNQS